MRRSRSPLALARLHALQAGIPTGIVADLLDGQRCALSLYRQFVSQQAWGPAVTACRSAQSIFQNLGWNYRYHPEASRWCRRTEAGWRLRERYATRRLQESRQQQARNGHAATAGRRRSP